MASLLRDAFISWDDFGAFWRQLEWMGLQRHLKCWRSSAA
jgi:aminoglycoside/choline kinase family phosphotransferase